MKYYNYLFYKFYKGAFSIRESGDPEFRAIFGLGITEGINFYSIMQIIIYFVYENQIKTPILLLALTAILILILNYFLFIYKDKYKKIIDEYKNESDKRRKIGTLLTWSYVLVTLALLIYAKQLQFS